MIVFVADLHLAPGAWASLPGLRGDSYRSFDQVTAWALRHHRKTGEDCRGVILGGDVFDAEPTPDDVHCYLRNVNQLLAANIPVIAIQGQHARSRTIPWTGIHPSVHHLKEGAVVQLGPFHIYGFDNMPGDAVREALTKVPSTANVLVMHQACKGAVPDMQERYDLDPAWVPPFIKLVLLGDIHRTWEYEREMTVGDATMSTTFMYSNSICMQSISESPDKSFIVVEDSGRHHRVPLGTRPFKMITVMDDSTLLAGIMELATAQEDSLVAVRYASTVAGVEEKFKAAARNVHLLFKPMPVEKVGNTLIDVDKLQTVSLDSCLSQMVNKQADGELHAFVTDLLRLEDPAKTIDSWRAKILENQKS